MRCRLVVVAVVGALSALGLVAGPSLARAKALQLPNAPTQTTAGICSFNAFTLSGSFTRLGGAATFTMSGSGTCTGLPSGAATLNLTFHSVGSWSCVAGTATGSGAVQTPGNGPQIVSAALVNTGGQYAVQIYSLTGAATGTIGTLPVPCINGSTQTTIGGSGTLTYAT
jgi:hypothetical protein